MRIPDYLYMDYRMRQWAPNTDICGSFEQAESIPEPHPVPKKALMVQKYRPVYCNNTA